MTIVIASIIGFSSGLAGGGLALLAFGVWLAARLPDYDHHN
ncbi:hypothetical protein ACOI93_06780 [Corynebacterium striatum]|nr:hypothetical protein [Corynebacterium striatum]